MWESLTYCGSLNAVLVRYRAAVQRGGVSHLKMQTNRDQCWQKDGNKRERNTDRQINSDRNDRAGQRRRGKWSFERKEDRETGEMWRGMSGGVDLDQDETCLCLCSHVCEEVQHFPCGVEEWKCVAVGGWRPSCDSMCLQWASRSGLLPLTQEDHTVWTKFGSGK